MSRLAHHGWRDLLLQVTGGRLDIAAPSLEQELTRELPYIDRTRAGFEDFALEGRRAIEPGSPARSLLFHALAAPGVGQDAGMDRLSAFPSLFDIDAVENYIYGARPPSLEEVRALAGGASLAIVVFAVEYRPASQTVHRLHADLCLARTGIARVGTASALYDARRRDFLPLVAGQPYAFRGCPCATPRISQ